MDYKSMTDLQLYKTRNQASNNEIFRRHKNYIYKESFKFSNQTGFKIPVEDIIQDMAILFFETIPKIDLKRLSSLDNFNFSRYMPYFFSSHKKTLWRKYRHEIITTNEDEYEGVYKIGLGGFGFFKKLNYPNSMLGRENNNTFLFDYLKTKLTSKEYGIIYDYFILREKKKNMAKKLKISPPLFSYYFRRTLNKVKLILKDERHLLFN